MAQMDRVRAHLRTKKHERLKNACPRCSSLRMKELVGDCYDRDGIRNAIKCQRCKTEFKCFAHGISEKDRSEYIEDWPDHVREAEEKDFDRRARSRGYIPVDEAVDHCLRCSGGL
jgi:formate dehydrogenase maturation protein FdhE